MNRVRLALRFAQAALSDLADLLTDWAIGPQCTTCGERRRGPRTLARHIELDHAGDPA